MYVFGVQRGAGSRFLALPNEVEITAGSQISLLASPADGALSQSLTSCRARVLMESRRGWAGHARRRVALVG
jgi:hypothetical protein